MKKKSDKKDKEGIVSVAELMGKTGLRWRKVAEFHAAKGDKVEVTTTCGRKELFPVWSWMKPMVDLDCVCPDCFGECQCYQCTKKRKEDTNAN